MLKKKILLTYCVPLINNNSYTNDVNIFRASWIMHKVSEVVKENYDLTFLVVFKTDDINKFSLSSDEAFDSIGIKNFGIEHIHIFHPNIGKDIGTYVQVARDYKNSDYDYFLFMSTTTTILHSMCITYLANALDDKNVGIAGVHGLYVHVRETNIYNPCLRTNLFAVRKDILPLIGSFDTIINDEQRYDFEHRSYNIAVRVLNYGLRVVVVTPQNEYLDWKDWKRNGGYLRNSGEYILASDNSSLKYAKLALDNWQHAYDLTYPSEIFFDKRYL